MEKKKAEQIAASFLKERPLTVRFNTSRASVEEILKKSGEPGDRCRAHGLSGYSVLHFRLRLPGGKWRPFMRAL